MYPMEYSITIAPTTFTTMSISAEIGSTRTPMTRLRPEGNGAAVVRMESQV